MKKSYYPITLAMLFLLMACGKSKKNAAANEDRTDSLSRPENVQVVAAIAKVEPANGFIELAAEVSGIVVELYKKEGDPVRAGEAICRLDKQTELLDVATARQNIITQQSRVDASVADIRQYEASLKEKEEDLAITERLAATGADTRQNVAIKQKEKEVIMANLQSARAQLKVGSSELATLKTKLEQAELDAQKRVITAKANGVLVSLDVKKGTAINVYQPFALLAPDEERVLHGEIDEMFADRVKVGQPITVNYVGNNTTITTGQVIYLSPILDNKSLFYEKNGETSDRRVRRFKASIASPESLLINARVECTIKLQ